MTLLLLSMLSTAQVIPIAMQSASSVPETIGNEIVVIARKARRWKGRINYNANDGIACRTRRSTKDPELDELLCETMITCVEANFDGFLALREVALPRRERRAHRKTYEAGVSECIVAEREALYETLAERRASAAR